MKKDSLIGSLIKGTIDLTATTIKVAYDVSEEIVKKSYEVATSEDAKKLYKKTGNYVVGLFSFTPPTTGKLTNKKLLNYLINEDEHIKKTYSSIKKKYKKINKYIVEYNLFKTHWRAICSQIVFGALAKTQDPQKYIEIKDYLILEILKVDPEIIRLRQLFYEKAYSSGGLNVSRILNQECFGNKLPENALEEFNIGFSLIHEAMINGLNKELK